MTRSHATRKREWAYPDHGNFRPDGPPHSTNSPAVRRAWSEPDGTRTKHAVKSLHRDRCAAAEQSRVKNYEKYAPMSCTVILSSKAAKLRWALCAHQSASNLLSETKRFQWIVLQAQAEFHLRCPAELFDGCQTSTEKNGHGLASWGKSHPASNKEPDSHQGQIVNQTHRTNTAPHVFVTCSLLYVNCNCQI